MDSEILGRIVFECVQIFLKKRSTSSVSPRKPLPALMLLRQLI